MAAADELAPHQVAQYALDLATAWNGYHNHRTRRAAPTRRSSGRAWLREAASCSSTRCAARWRPPDLLGVRAPEEM